MIAAGLDIGSRTIELVRIDEGGIIESRQTDSGVYPVQRARELIQDVTYERLLVTGYGRTMYEAIMDVATVTEIKAYGIGAHYFYPECRTVIDIGGQDAKVIAVNEKGKVVKFEMNDRCAAGTGKFLEIMARTLDFPIERFGPEALRATEPVKISSMCTVFAESEVTSLLARGTDPRSVALGLHDSVARRVLAMIKRVMVSGPVVLAGGVANNLCVVELLSRLLGEKIFVPEKPQLVGALGAAILAGRDIIQGAGG